MAAVFDSITMCLISVVLLLPNVYVLDFLFCNNVHVHFVFVV